MSSLENNWKLVIKNAVSLFMQIEKLNEQIKLKLIKFNNRNTNSDQFKPFKINISDIILNTTRFI